jgi:hypothetical protein
MDGLCDMRRPISRKRCGTRENKNDGLKNHALEWAGLLLAARIEADMVVSTGSTGQQHAVRMEGGGSERRSLVAKEARVGLEARDLASVKVKDLDEVRRGATINNGQFLAKHGEI